MEDKYEKIIPKKINHIDSFLDRFRKVLGNSSLEKDGIIFVIHKEFNIDLERGDIKILKNIAYLNISPVFKNEILMRKEKILKSLKDFGISVLDVK